MRGTIFSIPGPLMPLHVHRPTNPFPVQCGIIIGILEEAWLHRRRTSSVHLALDGVQLVLVLVWELGSSGE